MSEVANDRFFEIDALRGTAIVLMVVYHFFYDLDFFGIIGYDLHSGVLLLTGRIAAILFIFLVGVSLTLSYSWNISSSNTQNDYFYHIFKRGTGIFAWGLVITIVTAKVLESGTIYFGILHLIGVSIILAYPFLKHRIFTLFAGVTVLLAGLIMQNVYATYPWLLWLGVKPYGFYTLDYFPLIPWFGIVLLGIFAGNNLYSGYRRNFRIRATGDNALINLLGYLGKRSLFIYLVHQPLIVGILLLYKCSLAFI